MASCPRLRPPRSFYRRAILLCRRQSLQRFSNWPPEIKNHCSPWAKTRSTSAAIPKFTPWNQESLHKWGHFQAKPCSDSQVWAWNQESLQPLSQNAGNLCSDSQVYPLKSRIIAQMRAILGKTLPWFSSLGLKSRITARWLCDYDLQAEPFAGLFPVACTYSYCLSLLTSKAIISSLFVLSDFFYHDFNYCYNSQL